MLLLCPARHGYAQPDIPVTRILFEPVLIPVDPDSTQFPLVSFSSAESDIPALVTQPTLSLSERQAMEADIDRYIAVVGENEATEGPYSESLREDLFSTGLLYQQLGQHRDAIRLLERALNVSRINYGLENPDQVPLLEAEAQSYQALLENSNADNMMEAAYNIEAQHYGIGSVELVPALLSLGNWNTNAFMERSSILVNIPRMNVQNFLRDPNNYIQPQNETMQTPLFKLYQARSNYLNAIKNLVDARQYFNPGLLELERKLLTNYFLTMHQENILYEPDFYLNRKKSKTTSRLNQNAIELMTSDSYDDGRVAHQRIQSYILHDPQRDDARLALAMLEEADWDMLFQRKRNGIDKYQTAYKYFNETPELLTPPVQAILYPELPVVLPTYLPPPNSREKLGIASDAAVSYFGYIDVSFEINKYGSARKIKILRKEGEVTRNMEIRMNQYLKNVLFRPRFDGLDAEKNPQLLRYYLGV